MKKSYHTISVNSTDDEEENPKLTFCQKCTAFLISCSIFVYGMFTVSEYNKLDNTEKTNLDSVCADLIFIHVTIILLNCVLSIINYKNNHIIMGVVFAINVYWIIIHFKYNVASMIAMYAKIMAILQIVIISIYLFLLIFVYGLINLINKYIEYELKDEESNMKERESLV
tara:strand:+ start:2278 stop:2787 length:510 start_codon:yes stop_codon:yes gene_type:complete